MSRARARRARTMFSTSARLDDVRLAPEPLGRGSRRGAPSGVQSRTMKPHRQSRDDASDTSRELRALLGAFATYHRAPDERLPEGVSAVARDDAPRDARIRVPLHTRGGRSALGRGRARPPRGRAHVGSDERRRRAPRARAPRRRRRGGARERGNRRQQPRRIPLHRTFSRVVATTRPSSRTSSGSSEASSLRRRGRDEPSRPRSPPRGSTSAAPATRTIASHAGARCSGVYYVSVPEAACRGAEKDAEQGAEQGAEQAMLPADASLSGRLVLRLCAGAQMRRKGLESGRGGVDARTRGRRRDRVEMFFPSRMLHGVMHRSMTRIGARIRMDTKDRVMETAGRRGRFG